MRGRGFPLAIVVALALAACTLDPETQAPELEVPAKLKEANDKEPAVWPSRAWWTGFKSAELDKLMTQAEASNFDIAAAVARIEEAEAQVRIAGAALLPTLGGSGGVTRSRSPGAAAPQGTKGKSSTGNIFSGGLTASYVLDLWGKNRAALDNAAETANASRFDKEVVALTTVVAIADTYFQALAAEDELRIARDNLKNGETVLDAIKGRQAVGTAAGLDVAQQETLVAQLRAAIPPLEVTLRQSQNALAVLVGHAPESVEIKGGSMDDIAMPEVGPGLPSLLLQRRPDVKEAEAKLAAANANVVVARASFFPTIQLTGQGGLESSALSSLFTGGAGTYSLAAMLTQPIFEGGLLEGQLDLAKATYVELMQDYRKSVVSAFQDVDSALVAVRETAEQERLERAAVAAARFAYEVATGQLHEGTIDIITLLNTQQALFTSQNSLAQIRFNHLQALVSLYQALGGGWNEP